jgi:hypothetical protein
MKKRKPSQQKVPIYEFLSTEKSKEDVGANLVLDLIRAIEERKKKIKPSSFLTKK